MLSSKVSRPSRRCSARASVSSRTSLNLPRPPALALVPHRGAACQYEVAARFADGFSLSGLVSFLVHVDPGRWTIRRLRPPRLPRPRGEAVSDLDLVKLLNVEVSTASKNRRKRRRCASRNHRGYARGTSDVGAIKTVAEVLSHTVGFLPS